MTMAKLNATSLRWVGELADFTLKIRYRPGKVNVDADSLSRMPTSWEEYMQSCSKKTSKDVLEAIISATRLQENRETTWLTALSDSSKLLEIDQDKEQVTHIIDLHKAQVIDPTTNRVLQLVRKGSRLLHLKQRKRQELYSNYCMNGRM